ncbi:MAG: glycosyltransferase [Muribaculaceae bacterium]|nr:glycosyltransferase [Muribaculaceae bacterium]
MSTPVISIITVCYNASHEIEATLKSIKEQSFKGYEYIIIDGASKDNTLEVITQSGVEPTHLISERDKGIYDAMNKGLALAKGEYLMFLNAGDSLYSPQTLQTIADVAEQENPDVIYGDTAIVDTERNYLRPRKLRPPKTLTRNSFKNGMLVCHQAFLPKRELAMPYDTKYRFSADFDWCVKILSVSEKCTQIDSFIVNYLEEGATTRNHIKSLKERFRIMTIYYGLFITIFKHICFLFR